VRGVRREFGFDDTRRLRLLWWAIVVVLAAGILSFIARGADRPADPIVTGGFLSYPAAMLAG
jgi:hypothetical protein